MNSPELTDCIKQLSAALEQSIRLMDALIAVCIQDGSIKDMREETTPVPSEIAQALPILLQAVGSSSNTLVNLSHSAGLHTRDCYSVARSVMETAANICYILAEGPIMAERALRHARQKSYRDLARESKIGSSVINLMCSNQPHLSEIDWLRDHITEFTSRGGREKGWVDESIDDRIEKAGHRFGKSVLNALHFARFAVYRHSSEILHGTLFGALFFFGMTTPSEPRTLDELNESIGQQHMLILMAAVLALSAVSESFHRAYGFQKAYDRSNIIMESLRKISYFKNHSAITDSK
jgi:hypothetical protein